MTDQSPAPGQVPPPSPGYYPYPPPGYPPWEEDEIDLREYWRVLVRHKRMILGTTLVATVLAAIISFIIPKTYTATARILPPKEKSGGLAAALSGELSGLAALAGASLGGSTNADLMVGMLSSRSITDRIVDRFDLLEVYGKELRVDAREKLLDNLDASVNKKDAILTLLVDDHDPQRAADMANAFVEELDQLSRHLNLTEASRQRAFVEGRLVEVNSDLAAAEDALRAFQEEHGAILVEEQARSMIDLMGQLKGQLMAAQVQLGVTQRFASANSPEVDRLRTQIAELQTRIRNMEQGEGERNAGDIFIPTQAVPELGLRYARLLREVKVQETVFELLTRQYELSKMEEAKDAPTVQVLDTAVVPEKKSKPSRRLIVALAAMLSLLGASMIAVIRSASANGRQM
ncbi:MAG: Wzz/FepE/Etk N-terminal domain-containing protein [Nitrospirota bacterium]